MSKKSDLTAMQEMASANMDIRCTTHFVGGKTVKAGGEISFGIDRETFDKVVTPMVVTDEKPKYYLIAYIVNKEQFDKIKNAK